MIEKTISFDYIKRIVDINLEIEQLKKQKAELEAYFLRIGNKDLQNSKSKSICYVSATTHRL